MALEITSLEVPHITRVPFPIPGAGRGAAGATFTWFLLSSQNLASLGAEELLEGVREEELCGRKGRSVTALWPATR